MDAASTYIDPGIIPPFGVLSEQWLYPYSLGIGRLAERLEAFLATRLTSVLEDPRTCSRIAEQDGRTMGVACWHSLPWDSQLFGFEAGRIDLLAAAGEYPVARKCKTDLLKGIVDDCRNEGIRHLTARLNAGDFSGLHTLEAAGFEFMDGIQTFSLSLGGRTLSGPGGELNIRSFEPGDLDQILSIAHSAYLCDRFHADSALSASVADRVNEEWLRNSCLGSAADMVIVADSGGKVVGYVTCKIDHLIEEAFGVRLASIVMVATDRGARRTGVATASTLGALRWLHEQGVDIVEVGTQLRNIPAGRLYEGCGFRLVGVSLTFRKML